MKARAGDAHGTHGGHGNQNGGRPRAPDLIAEARKSGSAKQDWWLPAVGNAGEHSNFFDPTFDISSIPRGKEDDLYRLTKLFAIYRKKDELVRRLEYRSANEALLYFSGPGLHGGGVVIFKKQEETWVMTRKLDAT
jgi:hypothetical protein